MNILVLSVLCATSFLSHCMERPNREAIAAANNRLWKAAKNNDLAKIKQLIAEGTADVNSADIDSNTALMCAAIWTWTMNADITNALIKAGADINSVNDNGNTALICAAMNNHIDIVNALIKAGADINTVNKDGYTAFMLALYQRRFNASIPLINPSQKYFARKKIETLLAIHNKNCSYFSLLPKEVLKIIITWMHPEYAMDCESLRCFHPDILVDNIPLENLAILIKDGTLNEDTILAAWQKKINGITESLKAQNKLFYTYIEEFATEACAIITKLLANK
jgi:ankyrin repeat protein